MRAKDMEFVLRLLAVAFFSCCMLHAQAVERNGSSYAPERVLVLGSGGLVGRTLVEWLEERNYVVVHVRNRRHIDLRVPGALDVFNTTKLSYVFFLACEVGGSKFIESSARTLQIGIIESNIKMYQVVFPWLAAHKIPFVFTSSYLQGTANPYGVIKRLGEQWIHNLGGEGEGLGKTLRLWNVYGSENVGLKSHVLSDWSEQCVRRGFVTARSNGHEIRQFIHAQDVAGALGAAMMHHASLPSESDVSTGIWNDMHVLAADMMEASADILGAPCKVEFNDVHAGHREPLSPILQGPLHSVWKPLIDLKQGCKLVLEEYRIRKQVCEGSGVADVESSEVERNAYTSRFRDAPWHRHIDCSVIGLEARVERGEQPEGRDSPSLQGHTEGTGGDRGGVQSYNVG